MFSNNKKQRNKRTKYSPEVKSRITNYISSLNLMKVIPEYAV